MVKEFLEIQGLLKRASSTRQIQEFIEISRWASDFSAGEVEILSRYVHIYEAEKGVVLVREGSREAYLCLIVRGKTSVVKEAASHQPKVIDTIGPGRTFGEMSLIDGETRSASVVADESTLLIVLTKEGFGHIIDEIPRLGVKLVMKIAKMISQRLRQTSGMLVDHLGS